MEALTPREVEVVKAMAAGDGTSKDIAQRLSIAPLTAATYRTRIYQKADVHSAVELVVWAIRSKLVEI